jgi:hypothetical protein
MPKSNDFKTGNPYSLPNNGGEKSISKW